MISHEHRAIFIHIQKTGGDSVSLALGGTRREPRKHWSAADLKAETDAKIWADYFKFCFVRNPWARLVSWWSMIEAQRPLFQAGKLTNVLALTALRRANTFGEFLERMDDDLPHPIPGRRWSIWANQLDYLTDENGAPLVDFIGRTESLEQDMERVRQRLAAPLRAIERHNMSKHGPYPDHYSPAHRDLVAERYARDIGFFGYRFGHA